LQLVFKGTSIFAQQVGKMKVNRAPKEMMMDTHEEKQQADVEAPNHQFGKKSLNIIHIEINFFIYCNFSVRFLSFCS
jgi:hypothetical protein